MRDLTQLSIDELEALGVCECGQPLDSHDPLPTPKPLGRSLSERRGFPFTLSSIRSSEDIKLDRMRKIPTERLTEMIRILAKCDGVRNAAARELGVSGPTMRAAVRRAVNLGMQVPPARKGVRPRGEGYHVNLMPGV